MSPCCARCGAELRVIERPSDLDLLIVDSIELAIPSYGELLAHYANLIQDSASAEQFLDNVGSKANKDFLLALGGGLYEGLAQAAMLGKQAAADARHATQSLRQTPFPGPFPVNGEGERIAVRAVTGYEGNPIELDWFRQQAFTVAGVEQAAVLAKLKARIDDVVAGTGTWEDFRRTARDELLEAIGIEISEARLETVFDTNLASAHGAGKWLEGQAASDALPYWMYETVGDARVRPAHAAQQGKVYPKNHPYWNSWFPPNGFRCRCTVSEWDRGSLDRAKIKIESELSEESPDQGFGRNPADVKVLIEQLIDLNKLAEFTADSYDLGTLPATGILSSTLGLGNADAVMDYDGIPRTIRPGAIAPSEISNAERMIRQTIEDPQEVWGWGNRPQTYLRRFSEGGREYTAVAEILGDVRSARVVEGNGDEFRKGMLIKQ